jgi:DNA-binding beta-propeller fold protein YncE
MRNPTIFCLSLWLMAAGCDNVVRDAQVPLLAGSGLATGNSLWFMAPRSEALVRVHEATRDFERFEVTGTPLRLRRLPGTEVLLCLTADRRGVATLHRIDGADGEEPTFTSVEMGANFNDVAVTPEGSSAVVYVEASSELNNPGSLNPGEIRIVDLSSGSLTVASHTLTYRPLEFVFDPNGRFALVRTVDRLLLLELGSGIDHRDHQIPFQTTSGQARRLSLLEIGPDGSVALAAEEGSRDLFVLGTTVPAAPVIDNVVGLGRVPTDVAFDDEGQLALIADGSAQVTVLDLTDMTLSEVAFEKAVNRLERGIHADGPFVLAYHDGSDLRHLGRIDLADLSSDQWSLAAAASEVRINPEGTAAVVVHPATEVFDDDQHWDSYVTQRGSISLFAFGLRAPSQILLTDLPSDLRFIPGLDGVSELVVALPNRHLLVRYDLETYDATLLPTHAHPQRISVLPRSELAAVTLFTVHDSPYGLVSFADAWALEPPPGGFPAVAGFALSGILDPS